MATFTVLWIDNTESTEIEADTFDVKGSWIEFRRRKQQGERNEPVVTFLSSSAVRRVTPKT